MTPRERGVRPGRPATGAVGEARRPAAGGECPQQVGIEDEFRGVVAAAQRGEGADQEVVLGGARFAVDVGKLFRRLRHGGSDGVAAVVRGDVAAVGALGDGLRDNVQGAAGNQLEVHDHKGLKPGAEAAGRAPDTLGDRADLAVVLGQDGDDAVRLAQLVGAQHHAVVTVGAGGKGGWLGHG